MAKSTVLDKAIRMCDASNEEKQKNYNKLSKRLLRFVTMGTFKDLFEDRKEIERAYKSGSITEEHYKALRRESVEAETGIRRRMGEF